MQEKKEDVFEKLTGRATTPAKAQAQGKVAETQRQGGDVFEKLTGRRTESVLDQKIEVPNALKEREFDIRIQSSGRFEAKPRLA